MKTTGRRTIRTLDISDDPAKCCHPGDIVVKQGRTTGRWYAAQWDGQRLIQGDPVGWGSKAAAQSEARLLAQEAR